MTHPRLQARRRLVDLLNSLLEDWKIIFRDLDLDPICPWEHVNAARVDFPCLEAHSPMWEAKIQPGEMPGKTPLVYLCIWSTFALLVSIENPNHDVMTETFPAMLTSPGPSKEASQHLRVQHELPLT